MKALGPGIISGAAGNDPTTVATMAVIGSSLRYGLSGLTILMYPMLASVHVISTQVGLVAKRGLQYVVRNRFGRPLGMVLLVTVLGVNIVTVGADLSGGAAALELFTGVAWRWFVIPFGVAMLGLLLVASYHTVKRVLGYVLLVFIAYVAAALLGRPDWAQVLHDTVLPPISLDEPYVAGALALLGTTLTSYSYVWHTIEHAEERMSEDDLGLAKADAGVGILIAVSILWFIMIATAATLGQQGHPVQSPQDAARALKPIAGPLASLVFGAGLLGSAVLAVPVLAASSAYLIVDQFDRPSGLDRSVTRAPAFYVAIAITLAAGAAVTLLGIEPIQLLFIAAIVSGISTPISLAFLLFVARDREVMRDHPVSRRVLLAGVVTWVVVTVAAVAFVVRLIS